MDTRLKFAGGEIEISSDELNLMPESNRNAIHSINAGLSANQDMILSGVNAVIDAGVDVTIEAGHIFLNGETLKVDAQVVPKTEASDLYQFEKVTTFPSEGSRNFRDATTHDVYEINRAVAVNVAVLSAFPVDGETIIDVLKALIQVQSDWTQADNTQPDYIKNKPNVTDILLRGGCIFGDISGSPTGALTVSGGFTSAVKSNPIGGYSEVVFTFPSLGISTYHVSISVINNTQQPDIKVPAISNKTFTSFTLKIGESASVVQDIDFDIMILN